MKFFSILLLLPFLFLAGCSKRAPEIPKAKIELVLETIYALDRQDYRSALNKTGRLQNLDPANPNLKELEQVLKCNLPMADAMSAFQKGRKAEAVQILDRAILSQGAVAELTNARQDMMKLKRLDWITDVLLDPSGTLELRAAANELQRMRQTDGRLLALAEYASSRAERMMPVLQRKERALALYGIQEDLDRFSRTDPEKKEAFSAQKELFTEQMLK